MNTNPVQIRHPKHSGVGVHDVDKQDAYIVVNEQVDDVDEQDADIVVDEHVHNVNEQDADIVVDEQDDDFVYKHVHDVDE